MFVEWITKKGPHSLGLELIVLEQLGNESEDFVIDEEKPVNSLDSVEEPVYERPPWGCSSQPPPSPRT